MLPSRPILLAVALASGVATVLLAWRMAVVVAEFHRQNPREQYAFLPVVERRFEFHGREVSLEDDNTTPETPWLVLRYADQTRRVRVTVPPRHRLPGLLQHEEWLRVALFAPVSGMSVEQFKEGVTAGTIQTRLVVATRNTAAGADPETRGAANKKGWTFDFYELTADGRIEHEHLKYPTTRGVRRPKPGELQENTWQFQAALMLMPQVGGVGPTRNFFGDALSAAGWLTPAAAFAGLICTLSLAFAMAPRRGPTAPPATT
jgi:hypothetical protein